MRLRILSIGTASFMLLLPCLIRATPPGRHEGTVIPPGTQIQVRMIDKLNTEDARAGQTFTGSVAEPVVVSGRTMLVRGQKIVGRVTEAVSSGRLKQPASITLELTSVPSEPLRIDGKSHWVRNAEFIGGGAAAGALIGAIAGGKKGAAIGAAVGAGAGTAGAYLTGKKEIVVPPETELTFVTAGATGSASTAPAAGEERGSAARQPSVARASEGASAQPAFSPQDRRVIRDYFAGNYGNLPPGLAKRGGNLPPGLERHLERNGTLPPGLQKRVEPFPADLERRLPPLAAGFSRVILAGRALILDRNNTILDLMAVVQ